MIPNWLKYAVLAICGAMLIAVGAFLLGFWASSAKQEVAPPVATSNALAIPPAAVAPPATVETAEVDIKSAVPKVAPPPAVTGVAPVLANDWTHAEDLLALVNPARNAVVGEWKFEGAELRGEPGANTRIMVPYEVPREYDLRVDFTRRSVNHSVIVILSHQNRNVFWHFDVHTKGFYSGFSQIGNNAEATPTALVTSGEPHSCVIQVREQTLSAWLDGVLIRNDNINRNPPLLNADYRLPDQRCVGVGGYDADLAVHRISLRAVSGEGRPLPPDTDAERIESAEHWKDALDLLKPALSQANVISGKWTFENGEARAERVPKGAKEAARLQFNIQPPEEYDYRVEFMRDDGNYDVAQILSGNGRPFTWKVAVNGLTLLSRVGTQQTLVVDNPGAVRTPQLVKNGTYRLSVICVRKDGIRCYVDGRLMRALKTDYSNFFLEDYWKLRSPLALGIGVGEASATFFKAQLKEVTGKAKAIEVGVPAVPGKTKGEAKGEVKQGF